MAETAEITKVQIIIRKFLHETKDVVKDAGKSQKWLESFRNTLQYQDLEEFPNEFAMEILREAIAFNELQRKNAQFKQVRKILAENGVNNPTRSQIEQKWAEIYGDAAVSDKAEVSLNRESGVIEPTTISNFSGARESTRTDGNSLRVGNVARTPVRSGRNSRCPDSREDFHAFVADNKLHEGLAEEWYAIHEAREWVDKNGNPIKDWKGALYNYCTKTEQKRRTA